MKSSSWFEGNFNPNVKVRQGDMLLLGLFEKVDHADRAFDFPARVDEETLTATPTVPNECHLGMKTDLDIVFPFFCTQIDGFNIERLFSRVNHSDLITRNLCFHPEPPTISYIEISEAFIEPNLTMFFSIFEGDKQRVKSDQEGQTGNNESKNIEPVHITDCISISRVSYVN